MKNIKPVSYVKTNIDDILEFVNESKQPVFITQNGESRGVFLDFESYQNMKGALSMLQIFQISEKEISKGGIRNGEDVFTDLYRNHYSKNRLDVDPILKKIKISGDITSATGEEWGNE
jgi:PHD/YefM family antitoxin component YafN of YafNO toxin-antitoxin module